MRLTQYTFNDIVLLLQYFNARWRVYIGVKYPILFNIFHRLYNIVFNRSRCSQRTDDEDGI